VRFPTGRVEARAPAPTSSLRTSTNAYKDLYFVTGSRRRGRPREGCVLEALGAMGPDRPDHRSSEASRIQQGIRRQHWGPARDVQPAILTLRPRVDQVFASCTGTARRPAAPSYLGAHRSASEAVMGMAGVDVSGPTYGRASRVDDRGGAFQRRGSASETGVLADVRLDGDQITADPDDDDAGHSTRTYMTPCPRRASRVPQIERRIRATSTPGTSVYT
jgi:hypothetical protein